MDKVILTQEELQKLKSIQDESNQIILSLGNIEVQLMNLEDLKFQVKEKSKILQQQQEILGLELNKKYGQGTINLETGEFIKS